VLECVVNVSEGTRTGVLRALADCVSDHLLDLHSDTHHNRSVFTLLGETAPRALTVAALELLDVNVHAGVHPRLGVVDVVPFVPLDDTTFADAVAARNRFAEWAANSLSLPCFRYGPERSLPEVRRTAWESTLPDVGPDGPHPTAGAVCVGAREPLVAYNLWLENVSLEETRRIASLVRTAGIRTLGLQVGEFTQVSMNLVEPHIANPMHAVDAVARHTTIHHTELVGLIPAALLEAIPEDRWEELDLSESRTIEWRARTGFSAF
jgi:glutamate formiminotransferase